MWEQRKLERLGKIVTGSTPATSIREYYDGCFAFVSPADIQDNRFVESTKTTLTQAGFKRGRQLPSGASLFVSIGSTIGKVGQLKVSATTNQQINALINNSDTDSDFVYSLLEHSSDRLRRFSATQAVPILNKKSFSELRVSTPCLDEQIKIGRLFLVLDNTIALHQRKLELLKKLKQGYLQKLFPQDGRKVPQLRFAQFSDDWEKRKLSEFLTPSSDRNNAGKYDQDNILAASLGTELVKKHIFFGLRSTEKSVKSYYIVYPGDVIYTKSPIKGYPNGIVRTNKGVHGIVPSLYCVYHSTHEVNPSIIQVYFEDKYRLDAYLYPLVNVGARNNVNITNSGFLEGYICVSTDIKEQNEVVDIIELVNDNIALYHQKIKFLTKLKQGYLNNLFF
ncbi:restriction endonuclease subunit S [Agrilactobacillus composti]|uniref:restriction endonuclease subunit S n=1 Tax=Agrilactobacillus composti TaxID=398555 RepID=UPI0009DD995B|nr:restriction endonuclease subunit S [Agrilactobacillus composti]